MRILLILGTILLTFNSVSRAQYPLYPDSKSSNSVVYIDGGIGTYGFEVAVSSEPINDWAGALFLRGYPGPTGSLYTIDSRYLLGAELKYYGILGEGFYTGPLIGMEGEPSYRPFVGAAWGYDFFTKWSDKSLFKNIHAGFKLQAGIDTEGEGFIGVGVTFGVGYLENNEKTFRSN
jgi:hypothetical protein